jgi:hypothetical protein
VFEHKHVMVAAPDGRRFWLVCGLCSARVKIVTFTRPCGDHVRIVASARVASTGGIPFSHSELQGLARLWHLIFRAYVDSHTRHRPSRSRRYRPARASGSL